MSLRQLTVITYIIAAITSHSLTSLAYILSLLKTKKKKACHMETGKHKILLPKVSLVRKITLSYKALIPEIPPINVK